MYEFVKKIIIFEILFLINAISIYAAFEKGYASMLIIPGVGLVVFFTKDWMYER